MIDNQFREKESTPPKVSVILTSYNHAKYLGESIDSVINQTFVNFELLIWDDCSTDESWEVIQSYDDPRIKSFRTNETTYCGYINSAIEQTRGEYIAIHHSDDIWELDKLEKQLAFLEDHSSIGAIFTNAQAIGEDGEPLANELHSYCNIFDQKNRTRHEWLRRFFDEGNALCHPSVLIRKECYTRVGCYNVNKGLAQLPDLDMWIRLCLRYEIHVLPEKLVKFRVRDHESNTSGNRPETRIRTSIENYFLLKNYCNIPNFKELLLVFPEAQQYNRGEDSNVEFALAMLSLERAPASGLFAIDLLQKLISDPVSAQAIKKEYQFDYKNYIQLSGLHDVFSMEKTSKLLEQIDRFQFLAKDKNAPLFESKEPLSYNTNKARERFNKKITVYKIAKSGLFDRRWYLQQYPDVAYAKRNPILHYIKFGAAEGRDPHPLFDTEWYLAKNKDVASSGINPFYHYIEYGWREGRQPNPNSLFQSYLKVIKESGLFDSEWYLQQYPAVAQFGICPVIHYILAGATKGTNPSPFFNTKWYLETNQDVKNAGINPLYHYLRYGKKEGRLPCRFLLRNKPLHQQQEINEGKKTPITALLKAFENNELFVRGVSFLRRWNRRSARLQNRLLSNIEYHSWIKKYDTWTSLRYQALVEKLTAEGPSALQPTISVLLPVHNPPLSFLVEAVESVRAQVWEKWELCIVDDGSNDSKIKKYLTELEKKDSRVRLLFCQQPGGISAATNAALGLASGDFVAFLDHDDLLSPQALAEVVLEIRKTPEVGLIYTDEDKLDQQGERCDPFFKPDWNPDLLRSLNYCSHLSIIRRSLVLAVGGLDSAVDGAQDWDLLLRITEQLRPDQIKHISKVLYHWRISPASTAHSAKAKPHLIASGQLLLERHLKRTKRHFQSIEKINNCGHWRIKWALPAPEPLVSIIIPTRNGYQLLQQCVESIEAKTDYPHYEILIADNDSDEAKTLDYFAQKEDGEKIRIIKTPGPFNYSSINNRAVAQARGEIIVLLNNDIEVYERSWLGELVSHAIRPEIGAVGALLYYPHGTIQHAGVVLGIAGPMKVGGVAGHVGKKFFPYQEVMGNRVNVVQNFSAVTAACLAVRKKLYEEAGGLDEENLPVSFNDVDFCLKLLKNGYQNLWTPFSILIHHESATRGLENTPEKKKRSHAEIAVMRRRWGALLDADPAYNRNLTFEYENWGLAFPPRENN